MPPVSRRLFLARFTQGTAAIAVLGTVGVACGDEGDAVTTTTVGTSTSTTAPSDTTTTAGSTTSTDPGTATTIGGTSDAVTLERVLLGNVSAYVLARGGEGVVVDTGNPGSLGQIEAGLESLDLAWADVGHVVLTHLHPDHIGSLGDVMAAAPDATGYAGEADIPAIPSPRPLVAVGDGDTVFDLDIIETPGHTPGSISVLDPVGGILVVGDAMNGGDEPGSVAGVNPRFSSDLVAADDSIRKLAGFTFDRIYFGHGEPVESEAGAAVRAFAASL